MPNFTCINNDSQNLYVEWVDSTPFKSKGRIVNEQGRIAPSEYDGPKYQIISKKERRFSFLERMGRGFLGTLAIVCSLGLAFFSKSIKDLFIKHKKTIHFAELIDITPKDIFTCPKVTHQLKKSFCPDQTEDQKEIFYDRPLPIPPNGVLKNGYGEYLVYRSNLKSQKEPITDVEYGKIFDIIESSRSLMSENPYVDLKNKIQKELDEEIRIAFIPRTIYELIFLQKCIQEDLKNGKSSKASNTGILWAFQEETPDKQKVIENAMEMGFWQQCLFEDTDYETKFSEKNQFDYRLTHLKKVAARLNEVALSQFSKYNKGMEGFTYEEIEKVQTNLVAFFKNLHNPQSDLYKKASTLNTRFSVASSIAKEFAQEATEIRGEPGQTPKGIVTERDERILKAATQLESSAEAVNSLIVYRGSNFSKDFLMRKEEKLTFVNSLSYGTGLYAGALFDGTATAFQYMRKPYLDAHAFIVPLKEQQESRTPFHIYNVHPLIQLLSKGEIFHPRTKVWETKEENQRVLGFLGLGQFSYSKINECCRTDANQEKMEDWFQDYRSRVYILAPKKEL